MGKNLLKNLPVYIAPSITMADYAIERGFDVTPFVGESTDQTGSLEYTDSNDLDI